MASEWNLWVWLQYIGVASGCCFMEVYTYRFPHNTYLYSMYYSGVGRCFQLVGGGGAD